MQHPFSVCEDKKSTKNCKIKKKRKGCNTPNMKKLCRKTCGLCPDGKLIKAIVDTVPCRLNRLFDHL